MCPEDPKPKDRVLVVDDEPDILRLMSLFLKHQGYEVATAQSGLECLRKVREEKPDLLILDVMMPDMNGFEVCAVLRDEEDEDAPLPIVLLSALADTPDKIKGLKVGADEYLTKPVDMAELAVRLETLLSHTRRFQRASPTQAPVVKLGRTIGFIGGKGGVGTTTIALNTAAALSLQKKSVIAIEMRPYYGTFALQLRLTPRENLAHLLDTAPERINERALTPRLYKTSLESLRVLPGPQSANQWGELGPAQAEAIVRATAAMADYIVVDLPSVPGHGVELAARACDLLGIVLEPDMSTVLCARKIQELLGAWNLSGGQIGVVINNRSGAFNSLSLRQVQIEMGCEVWGMAPHALDLFSLALAQGTPLVAFRPESVPALAFSQMAERLMQQNVVGIRT